MNNVQEPPRTPEAAETPQTTTNDARQARDLPEVLTVAEAASLLRVNRKTLYESIRRGEIPGARHIGGTVRIHRDRLLQWLADGQGPRSSRGVR